MSPHPSSSPRSRARSSVPWLSAFLLFAALAGPGPAPAAGGNVSPDGIWAEIDRTPPGLSPGLEMTDHPLAWRTYLLDQDALAPLLARAPAEFTVTVREVGAIISLPMPDGTYSRFRVWNSPILGPEMAALHPGIETFSARGIDDPACLDRAVFAPLREGNGVRVRSKGHVLHAASLAQVDLSLLCPRGQFVLEAAAVDLVVVMGRVPVATNLDPPRDVVVVTGGQEEPKAVLDDVELLEVLLHAHDLGEVVSAGRDGRLANLERRLRRDSLALVEHYDVRLRPFALQLDREREARKPAAQDRGVIGLAIRHVSSQVASVRGF